MDAIKNIATASGAHLWMECPASAYMMRAFNTDNEWATKGRKLHEFAARALKEPVEPADETEALLLESYVKRVKEIFAQTDGQFLHVEEVSDVGTPDVWWANDKGDYFFMDLKTGRVPVEADSLQLLILAANHAHKFGVTDGIYSVWIFQPFGNDLTAEKFEQFHANTLLEWYEIEYLPRLERVYSKRPEKIPGSHCGLCPGNFACLHSVAWIKRTVEYPFEELIPLLNALKRFVSNSETKINELVGGGRIQGWEMVKVRSGWMGWDEKALSEALGVLPEEVCEIRAVLKSPKKLKESPFGQAFLERNQDFIRIKGEVWEPRKIEKGED